MTKVPVNIPGFVPNMTYGTTKVQDTESKSDFSKILENQKNAGSEARVQEKAYEEDAFENQEDAVRDAKQADDTVASKVEEAENSTSIKETSESGAGKQTQDDDMEQEFTDEEMNLMMPMLNVASMDVKELLAQELGISLEELNALMESMEITEADLLDLGTLKEVFLQASGAEDMAALLTDESLYAKMQSLEMGFAGIMENVQETLGLADEEMAVLKGQLSDMNAQQTPVVTVEEISNVDAASEQNPADNGENNGQAFAAPNQNIFTVQNLLEQMNAVSQQETRFVSVETENIMNQIMDYMKIQLDADTSALEMQLQPESLGTLQIRISAKEGVMTAQFTTASEAVKAALESQMVQLQQQFDNQNIKVEAIEVTVQTHQFESALEQGEERQQAEEDKKNRTRKIDLNNFEELDEISEEDRIVAEMMAANGNTVDYLA